MEQNQNMLVWFEIPVLEMERAISFYEKVFSIQLSRHQMGPLDMAWFPGSQDGQGATGSLVCHKEFYTPNQQGTLVYLRSSTGDLDKDLETVQKAGGQVLVPKTLINDEVGYMCVFKDSEGNRIAIHTDKG